MDNVELFVFGSNCEENLGISRGDGFFEVGGLELGKYHVIGHGFDRSGGRALSVSVDLLLRFLVLLLAEVSR